MFPEGLQHESQIGNLFVSIFGVIQDILYKYHHKRVHIGSENSIHMIHEGCRGIGQAKTYHDEFIVTKSGSELGF